MQTELLYDRVRSAAASINGVISTRPSIGIVLGSGLGALADRITRPESLAYSSIPHFPSPGVPGHAGRLVVGRFGGREVAAMQGRFHYYEGHELATVTLPVRVLAALGATIVILTAAAGGIAPGLAVGELACLRDHMNFLGANPLRGPHDDRLGPRFPDMTHIYDPALRALARLHAHSLGIPLTEAVYAAMPGPSYETPAEIAMLRALGADLVGMSTVPEAIVARQCGMRVLALALVSNAAAGLGEAGISHEEVLAAGRGIGAERLGNLIERVLGDPGLDESAREADQEGSGVTHGADPTSSSE